MTRAQLYEDAYERKDRFSFGKNWSQFSIGITDETIAEAMSSLQTLLGVTTLKGKTFLDIGCGSGLFSLAAHRLGAKTVTSVDVDKFSVATTKKLWSAEKKPRTWTIISGSALDEQFLKSLGTYDIVYSWGVLHHTGNMNRALDLVAERVGRKGLLTIAIYNDNTKYRLEGTSQQWTRIKQWYNSRGAFIRRWSERIYGTYILCGVLAHGRNPFRYVRNYRGRRGMNFWTDIRDWLGGYPYEYATTTTLKRFFEKRKFTNLKAIPARSLGCNELVFQRIG